MSQQEMSFDNARYEQSHDEPPRISGQYGQYQQQQSAQKLRPRGISRRIATRIQLSLAYISLLTAMLLAFIFYPNDYYYNSGGLLLLYIIILVVNLLVFLFLNFKVTVTRKHTH